MKAILVIDMPTNCAECKLIHLQGIGEAICNAVDWEERPSWCPLKPMPDYNWHEEDKENECEEWYRNGWNDCLDAIAGETEWNPY